jgi:hypothetical protein
MPDKLRSYGVAHLEPIPEKIRSTKQYEINRVEQSHETTSARDNEGERAGHAEAQISQAGSEVFGRSCRRQQFIQSRQTPGLCLSLLESQGECVH